MVFILTLLAALIAACGVPPADAPEEEEDQTEQADTASSDEDTDADDDDDEMTDDDDDEMTDDDDDEMTDDDDADTEEVADLEGRTLIVGSDTTYPPMEFIDEETREVVGFDVDMMNAIAERINAEVEFETFPNFDAIFAALANGDFDLVVSSVSVTEEREQIIDFSDPYLSIGQVISVQQDNDMITSAEDLADADLVGVQGGTTGEQAAMDAGVTEDQLRRYDTIDLAFQDLANGAVDAVVADGPPSAQYTEQFEDEVKVIGEPFTTENYAIALQKGDEELQTAINAALDQLKEDGTLEELMEKWNLQDVASLP
jgi:polar amino acid transport system substrate-binding protein